MWIYIWTKDIHALQFLQLRDQWSIGKKDGLRNAHFNHHCNSILASPIKTRKGRQSRDCWGEGRNEGEGRSSRSYFMKMFILLIDILPNQIYLIPLKEYQLLSHPINQNEAYSLEIQPKDSLIVTSLACLIETRAQKSRNLLDDSFRCKKSMVLLGKLLDQFLVLVELFKPLYIHVLQSYLFCLPIQNEGNVPSTIRTSK